MPSMDAAAGAPKIGRLAFQGDNDETNLKRYQEWVDLRNSTCCISRFKLGCRYRLLALLQVLDRALRHFQRGLHPRAMRKTDPVF